MKRFLILFLFFIPVFSGFSQNDYVHLNIQPGYYKSDQQLVISGSNESTQIYYRFSENTNDSWSLYSRPLFLSAVTGEERLYTLQVKGLSADREIFTDSFIYVIDKKIPGKPSSNVPSGKYKSNILLSLDAPNAEQIFYSINSGISSGAVSYEKGGTILLRADANLDKTYQILAYSSDRAGNSSEISSFNYIIRASGKSAETFEILSPVSGDFANKQLLYVEHSGYEWVKYSIKNKSTVLTDLNYSYPVLLPYTGNVTVTITAKPLNSGSVTSRSVTYQVNEDESFASSQESGIYNSDIKLDYSEPVSYSAGDGVFVSQASAKSIIFKHVPDSLKKIIFSYSSPQSGQISYRYVYLLDSRKPFTPIISTEDPAPVNRDTYVSISSDNYSSVFYTLDGSSPDQYSNYYSGPFLLELPDGVSRGSSIIKARAIGRNGLSSIEVNKLVIFDREKPGRPDLEVKPVSNGTVELICIPAESGDKVYFEISNNPSSLAAPDASSSKFSGSVFINAPLGTFQEFRLNMVSIDKAGNISDLFRSGPIQIDCQAPNPPEFAYENSRLIIKAEGSIYYSLSNDGSIPSPASVNSSIYSEPIEITFDQENVHQYVIRAVCIDDSGNVSGQSELFYINEDSIFSDIPQIRGVENGKTYNSAVVLSLQEPRPDYIYYYSVNGPDPDDTSMIMDGDLIIEGEQENVAAYTFKICSYNPETGNFSRINTIYFDIDRNPPDVPAIPSLKEINYSARDIIIDPPQSDGSDIYYTLSETSSSDISQKNILFAESLHLSCPPGIEKQYFLRIWSQDAAGNMSVANRLYTIIIDKKPPETPKLSAHTKLGLGSNNQIIEFEKNDDSIYYIITNDGSLPDTPGPLSSLYKTPVQLSVIEGSNITYTIQAVAIDRVGNISNPTDYFTFIITGKNVPAPAAPAVYTNHHKRLITVSWASNPEYDIFCRIGYDKSDAGKFSVYTSPLEIQLHEYFNSVRLEYYYQDQTGNKSIIKSSLIDINSSGSSIISGVANEAFYNSEVIITKNDKKSIVKYEIAANGEPPQINEYSPFLNEDLHLDVPSGESVQYSLRVFKKNANSDDGTEDLIHFTIDRKNPLIPVLEGIGPTSYFQDRAVLNFKINERESVYFQINDSENSRDLSFSRFTDTVTIESSSDETETYYIKAFSEDFAGNRSRVKTWKIIIESQIVYVSSAGSDSNDGGRENPFKSLQHAVNYAERNGRKKIYLGKGNYSLDQSIAITRPLQLVGGLDDYGTWLFEENSFSKIELTGQYSGFILETAELHIENIAFSSSVPELPFFITNNNGKLEITGSVFTKTAADNDAAVIIQNAGFTYINNSKVKTDMIKAGGSVIDIKGGLLKTVNSSYYGSSCDNPLTFISLKGKENHLIDKCHFYPGDGDKIKAVKVKSGNLSISDSYFASGRGIYQTTSVEAVSSKVSVTNSEFIIKQNAGFPTVFNSINSILEFSANSVKSEVDSGLLLFNVRGGSLYFNRNTVSAAAAKEFIYYFNSSKCDLYIHNNGFINKKTPDYIALNADGGYIEIIHNTFINEGSDDVNIAFKTRNTASLTILNNIINMNNISNGTAAVISGPLKNIDIRANNFFGFANLVSANGKIYRNFTEMLSLSRIDTNSVFLSENINLPSSEILYFADGRYYPALNSVIINKGVRINSNHFDKLDYLGNKRPNGSSYNMKNDLGYIEMGPH